VLQLKTYFVVKLEVYKLSASEDMPQEVVPTAIHPN